VADEKPGTEGQDMTTIAGMGAELEAIRLRVAFSSWLAALPVWRRWGSSWPALWAAFNRERGGRA
jgi:hypothetical protein